LSACRGEKPRLSAWNLSKPAFKPSITAPLPLVSDQPRFAPESLKTWGCDSVELWHHQVAPLSGSARQALRQSLNAAGLITAFITSIDESGEGWSLETLREAVGLAASIGAECVVTYAPPQGPTMGMGAQDAADWLAAAATLAEASSVPLLVENRPGTWADSGSSFNRFLGQVGSPWLRAAFDPAGFAALREHPFLTAFMPSRLKSRVHLIRIRDARFEDGLIVPLNQGNAEIAELVSAAMARSFDADADDIRRALADFGQLLEALGLEELPAAGSARGAT
jgi:sugar phosphate isomerase/epimerase